MYLKNKKLIAILGGRLYKDSLTLRRFLIPPIREKFKKLGIDFIIATNNSNAAEQFKQIKNLTLVETSAQLHNEFMLRQKESKPNLGAETRETINQYAIKHNYNYVCHLDDNIISLFYYSNFKNKIIKKNKPLAIFDIINLLFYIAENSNSAAVGIEMSAFGGNKNYGIKITAGFPYSLFVHKINKNFKFENATEDDILMSIYNGLNHSPSSVIRNTFFYGKTGKTQSNDGNRKLYNDMLKENKRGEYAEKMFPEIYSRKTSYMVKSSTIQKRIFLQHKHKLKKPKLWDIELKYNENIINEIKNTLDIIRQREQ